MRILLIIRLFLIPIDNFACSCERVGIVKNKRENTYVFKGHVKSVNETTSLEITTGTKDTIEYKRTKYSFEIIKNYKGQNNKETVDLISSGMTDCGVDFEAEKLILFMLT